jgi:phosphate transport system substrate-binding protein
MKTFSKKSVIMLLILIALTALSSACSTNQETTEEGGLSGTITLVGSTSVTPVAQELADAFTEKETGVKVEVQGVGSSAGIKASVDGSADIGMSSRNLKDEEKELGIEEHIIAYDGIAIVVHPSNEVSDLTAKQISKIYKGDITNWSEVGGKDAVIEVISREEGSGTRGAFEELMGLESDEGTLVKQDATISDGNGAVYASVAQKETSIGYLSLSYLDEQVKTLKADGVEPTVENIKAGTYKVSRPFLMLTKGEVSDATQAYLDFVFSPEGQEIVVEEGVISVN